jgi:hypothetical protein
MSDKTEADMTQAEWREAERKDNLGLSRAASRTPRLQPSEPLASRRRQGIKKG